MKKFENKMGGDPISKCCTENFLNLLSGSVSMLNPDMKVKKIGLTAHVNRSNGGTSQPKKIPSNCIILYVIVYKHFDIFLKFLNYNTIIKNLLFSNYFI